ncbi:hypothetical protein KCP73_18615 [Salmonella enterica subsp. enterica]|nr:hypothetical protein KCP73_18615 [Salmonella enterica subsp. enterica]
MRIAGLAVASNYLRPGRAAIPSRACAFRQLPQVYRYRRAVGYAAGLLFLVPSRRHVYYERRTLIVSHDVAGGWRNADRASSQSLL